MKKKVNSSILKKLDFSIDISPKKEFGDVSSNIAMIICKSLKLPPIELAMKIVTFLKQENQIMKVEVVKPGFINIFFIILFGKTNYMSI